MKLAFSTLGCPDWDLDMIIRKAKEFTFDGIEFRGIGDQLDISQLPEFTSRAQETLRKINDTGVEICCFSSSVFMSNMDLSNESQYLDEIKRYAQLCEIFHAPYIRIFGGSIGKVAWEEAIDRAAEILTKMVEIVKDMPVRLAIETHDDWMHCEHFRKLMERVNSEKVGILWDVNHPYMFVGEEPEKTWECLRQWICHTHWKDSQVDQSAEHGFVPCLMGDGVLPHYEIFNVLRKGGFDGYLSLEWEKRWHPEIPGPEIAFPQYVEYMNNLMKKQED